MNLLLGGFCDEKLLLNKNSSICFNYDISHPGVVVVPHFKDVSKHEILKATTISSAVHGCALVQLQVVLKGPGFCPKHQIILGLTALLTNKLSSRSYS